MFSWIQTRLQKHFRYLFIVVLAIVICSFVFVIGDFGGIDSLRRDPTADLRFFDYELNTEEKRTTFMREASLAAYLNFGQTQLQPAQVQTYALNRATALHLADQHNIPDPTQEQLQEFLKELALFQNSSGEFDPQAYASALDSLQVSYGAKKSEIAKVIRDEYRAHQIQEILAGPGYALPAEALDELERAKTVWSVAVATVDLSEYKPEVEVTEEKLAEFYERSSARYQRPARRSVAYVTFPFSEFKDEVAVDEATLRAYFDRNFFNYSKEPEAGDDASAEATDVSFEDVKEQVEQDYRQEQAKAIAEERATDLVMSMVDAERDLPKKTNLSVESGVFKSIIDEFGRETKSAPPFSRHEVPMGTGWSRKVASEAFTLSPSRIYSDPITDGETVYVLFYESEIPENTPELKEVRERVEADFIREEQRRLRSEYGKELQEELSQFTGSKDEFLAAAEERGLKTEAYDSFTRSEPPQGLSPDLIQLFNTLSEGEVSRMATQGDRGRFVFVAEKDVPDLEPRGEEFEQMMEQLTQSNRAMSASALIAKLRDAERERAGL